MDYEKAESEIEDIKTKMDEKRKEMEVVANSFIEESIPFVIEWCEKQKRRRIIEKPDVVTKLNEAGNLSKIKADLALLIENLPQSIREKLGKERAWTHKQDFKQLEKTYGGQSQRYELERVYSVYSKKLPDILNQEILNLFGLLGEILLKYKLENRETEWKQNYRNGNTEISYRYSYDVPDNLRAIVQQYDELNQKFAAMFWDVEKKAGIIDEARAQDMWDDA